jgi:hypothetical protein
MQAQPLLSIEGVETFYGNIRALNGVTMRGQSQARSSR